jgi:hypothetical protein
MLRSRPMTCAEVGIELGVTASHACQLALDAHYRDVEHSKRFMAVWPP